jgi:metal-responsive CopG/Arc/MetJ family transcriptional regulator
MKIIANIVLSHEILAAIDEIAAKEETSRSALIRQILKEYLKEKTHEKN